MKNTIASISFVCYLAVTSGILVNFHYCMDRLASLQLFASQNRTCSKCGMHITKSHGCCRDEVKIIKMEVDQKATSNIVFELPPCEPIAQDPSDFIASSIYNGMPARHYQNHSPPLLSGQYDFLVNGVFRI